MNTTLIVAAVVFGLASISFLGNAITALRRARPLKTFNRLVAFALCLALGGLFAGLALGTSGYRALTREELAARIEIERLSPERFTAVFEYVDGRRQIFDLAGDEFYVDARILKWKAPANLIGLHTAYELDRVAGRYVSIDDERSRSRSVFPLAAPNLVDLFALRRRFPILEPLVDAEYGSASYVTASDGASLELLVSTTGLLLRETHVDAGWDAETE